MDLFPENIFSWFENVDLTLLNKRNFFIMGEI